jgi:hypothetical protein
MYQQMIREDLATLGRLGTNPAHVEGWMRSEHSTLDGLSRAQFREEVEIAAQCVNDAGPGMSAALASSFGL